MRLAALATSTLVSAGTLLGSSADANSSFAQTKFSNRAYYVSPDYGQASEPQLLRELESYSPEQEATRRSLRRWLIGLDALQLVDPSTRDNISKALSNGQFDAARNEIVRVLSQPDFAECYQRLKVFVEDLPSQAKLEIDQPKLQAALTKISVADIRLDESELYALGLATHLAIKGHPKFKDSITLILGGVLATGVLLYLTGRELDKKSASSNRNALFCTAAAAAAGITTALLLYSAANNPPSPELFCWRDEILDFRLLCYEGASMDDAPAN